MKDTPTEAIRKEFTAHHLGKPAQAGVDLDQSGKFVSVIGFGFATQTDQQCITDAVGALAELERRYGTSYNATDQPPGKRATWIAKSGVVVRWAELCAAGARRYFISYAKNEN